MCPTDKEFKQIIKDYVSWLQEPHEPMCIQDFLLSMKNHKTKIVKIKEQNENNNL